MWQTERIMQESESTNNGNIGRKPKYDYTGKKFLSLVESYAKKGFTDKEIAYALNLYPTYFCELKGQHSEISESLSRGRAQINAAVRAKYLAVALGGIKTKNTVTRKLRMADGTLTDDEEIQTTESELAPSLQAMSTWLYHHDEEWRRIERNEDLDEEVQSDGSIPISKWIDNNTETPEEK